MMLFGGRFSRSLVLATDCLADQINASGEAGLIVAIPEKRFDVVFGDIERRDVRQRAFQSVTHLNKHLAILDEHEEHDAIAAFLFTDAPRLCQALRVVRDV